MLRAHRQVAVSLIATIAITLVSGGVTPISADDSDASQAEFIGGDPVAYTPASLRDASVLVHVSLAADPVAVLQARAGRKLDRAEKDAIKRRLQNDQGKLLPSIQRLGGDVEAQMQTAVNALRVRIPRSAVSALRSLPGVTRVDQVELMVPANTTSVPYIGAPTAWTDAGVRGEGVKIGIIDTGIDYMHANFGGPGTVDSFDRRDQTDQARNDPTGPYFGPDAPKVKGGIDLVGSKYDAGSDNPARVRPHPDPDPLDCNGHGSHVAGTAAGFGVLNDGATYKGAYNASIYATNQFRIGPGVAPKADLYAIRVFGCEGSTAVTVQAIDWAVDNDMDVINMSLGSSYGRPDNLSAIAADNAAAAGVIVVASAGNSGAGQYITGSPAAGTRAISVAANDAVASFPGATLTLTKGTTTATITAINANGATFSDGTTWPIKVLRNANGTVKKGCNHPSAPSDPSLHFAGDDAVANDYVGVAGTIVVVERGVCARVARAIYGQKEGALAVAMINNSTSLPPFEGPITSNPDSGEAFTVTIPFLGVRGTLGATPASDGDTLVAADTGTAAAANTSIANPGFTRAASFSSGGPRMVDSFLKPDVTAPGVSTNSTSVGTGDKATRLSGTSMAAPHVTGVAALTKQAHPGWSQDDLRAAIVTTSSPAAVGGYRTSRAGAGLVQPARSTKTDVVATTSCGTGCKISSVNLGFAHLAGTSYSSGPQTITLKNNGSSPATFNVSTTANSPFTRTHSASVSAPSVTVAAGATATVTLSVQLTAANAGSQTSFNEVAGTVNFAPSAGNNGVSLTVPYYLVPRVQAATSGSVSPAVKKSNASNTFTVTNSSANPGSVRAYTWGIEDADEPDVDWFDLRYVGVRAFDVNIGTATKPLIERRLEFAVNFWAKHSIANAGEVDIHIDNNGDGIADRILFAADLGLVQSGSFNGTYATFTFDPATGVSTPLFGVSATTDQSTLLLTFRAEDLGLDATSTPRFTYRAAAFNFREANDDDVLGETGRFNAYTPAISTPSGSTSVPAGGSATVNTTTNAAEWDLSAPKGVLLVYLDNAAGPAEAERFAATP